jgi:hypothetical protein
MSCKHRAGRIGEIAADFRKVAAEGGEHRHFRQLMLDRALELEAIAAQIVRRCSSDIDVVWADDEPGYAPVQQADR